MTRWNRDVLPQALRPRPGPLTRAPTMLPLRCARSAVRPTRSRPATATGSCAVAASTFEAGVIMPERPLSPHVTIYKWAYTMTLSILHRISGIVLSAALIMAVIWLLAAAGGAAAYAHAMSVLASPPFKCLVAIALLALCYHFCNGLRHLAWDMGYGFERPQARRSAVVVVVVTLLAAVMLIYALFRVGAGSP